MDAWLAISAVATRRRGMNHVCAAVLCFRISASFPNSARGKKAMMGDTDRERGDLPHSLPQSWTFLFFRPVKKMTTVSQSVVKAEVQRHL